MFDSVADGDIDAFSRHAATNNPRELTGSDTGMRSWTCIEPDAGIINLVVESAIPEYGLDYAVVEGSTPVMLFESKRMVDAREPIVSTAWKPHWLFAAYLIRQLEDSKGAVGRRTSPP